MKLKRLSLNHIVLIFIPIVIIILGFLFDRSQLLKIENYIFSRSILYYLFFGFNFFQISFIALWLYVLVKVASGFMYYLLRMQINGFKKTKDTFQKIIKKRVPIIKKVLFFLISIQFGFLSMFVIANRIGDVDPDKVAYTSERLMQFDYSLFGTYPPFALQDLASNEFIDELLVGAYLFLSVFLSFVVIFLITTKPMKSLRMFIFSFFFAVFLAIPFWYLFSAVTPNEMYRENKLEITENGPVWEYVKIQTEKTSTRVAGLLKVASYYGSRPDEGHYHVPTFPSMHIAWSVVIVFFGFHVWPKFGFLCLLWAIINAFGAVYMLQHYAVDVLLGLFIGTCAVALSYELIKLEEKKFFAPPKSIGIENIQNDIKKFLLWIRGLFKLL